MPSNKSVDYNTMGETAKWLVLCAISQIPNLEWHDGPLQFSISIDDNPVDSDAFFRDLGDKIDKHVANRVNNHIAEFDEATSGSVQRAIDDLADVLDRMSTRI